MLLRMIKGYFKGEYALGVDDTVPTGANYPVSDALAETLIEEGFAERIDASAPIERATAPAATRATGPAQKAK